MHTATSRPALLGIVGAGRMGRGIAQIAAQGGIPVVMHDARPGAARQPAPVIGALPAPCPGMSSVMQTPPARIADTLADAAPVAASKRPV